MTPFTDIDAKYGLPAGTTARIMQVESGGDPNAVSSAGAQGKFQVMPATQRNPGYGVAPFSGNDPNGAAAYFAAMRNKFGSIPLAAAAYNWGPGNLEKYGIDKAPAETQAYVQKVTDGMNQPPSNLMQMLNQRASEKQEPSAGLQNAFSLLQQRAAGKLPNTPKSTIQSAPVDPTAGMSGFDKFMAGVGKAAVGTGEGIEQLGAQAGNKLGLVSDQTVNNIQNRIDEHAKLDKPLMHTGAGVAGDIAGNVGSFFLPGGVIGTAGKALSYIPKAVKAGGILMDFADALNAANKLKTATAIGAGSGAVQPVATGQSRLENIGLGALGGGLGYGVGKTLGYGYNVAKGLVAPFFESGRSGIVGNALKDFAGSNDLHSILNNAKTYVPGSMPTTAQVLADQGGNYSLLPVERAVQNASPDVAGQFAQRQLANNAARLNSLRSVAGTPEDVAGAQAARNQTTAPLLNVLSKSTAKVNTEPTVNLIDNIIAKNPARRQLVSTLNSIRDNLDGLTSPSDLYSASKDISDVLNQKGPTGAKVNQAIARELTVIKRSLDNQIAKAEPAYGKYLKAYSEMSRPLDQMKIGQTIIDRSTSGSDRMGGEPALYPESFGRTIKSDKDLVKKATGFARNKGLAGTMTPAQMDIINGVRSDLNRQAAGNAMAKAVGSNTVQNLATNNLLTAALGNKLASTPLGGLLLSRPLSWAIKPMEQRLTEQLGGALLNPDVAARLVAPKAINPLYQRMLAAGRMGLLGTTAYGLPQASGLLGQ